MVSLLCSMLLAAGGSAASAPKGVLPPTNPTWKPTYNLSMSTITMTCNGSGWSSPERGAQFGIVSYDWSNAKVEWAAAKPMDCEKRLQTQAQMTKAHNPESHVFVYRNVVKALPWFSSVREKLDDPAYSGWFLKFDPEQVAAHNTSVPVCAAEDPKKCSAFYHDQEQTPAVPTETNPHPDGSCTDDVCDVGTQPCGEYLFDHRNGSSLRNWIVNELIGGPMGLGDPAISGFFIDDYWCSNKLCEQLGCRCTDPVQGATEIDAHQQVDMGLTDDDIADLTVAWNETMGAVQKYILDHGGYTWSLIPGQENANASPLMMTNESCAADLRAACVADSRWQKYATLYGFQNAGSELTQLQQDLAFFLLARGRYAWIGWGTWGIGWPFNPEPAHGTLPARPHGVPLPTELLSPEEGGLDVGEPMGICKETSAGVFTREYSKISVQLDCGKFEGKITKK